MAEIFARVEQVAVRDTTVLITGESGTGKELIARQIHDRSARKNGPFVAINCAAIPETLIESELFGHEKGAFTHAVDRRIGHFELANGGTLFLDEIGELSLGVQVKMLRFLQEQEFFRVGRSKPIQVDVRIVTATNKNLEDLVKQKLFRQDLFYRINVINLCLPPLRERYDDIPILIEHFIKQVGHDVTLGDYGAVAAAIRPELATYETFKIVVDTTFGPSRGQTLCDRREWKDEEPESTHAKAPNVKVAMKVDVPAMISLWLETISSK
jgi:transcriptional regulator with GAF, ATPase, and Fis domain